MKEYQNRQTGEVLTEQEARNQWQEEYDGGDDTNDISFEEYYAEMLYVYGMRLRGYSPGCQPMNGIVGIKEETTGKYHNLLIYDRKLTDKELYDYELDFIKPITKEDIE